MKAKIALFFSIFCFFSAVSAMKRPGTPMAAESSAQKVKIEAVPEVVHLPFIPQEFGKPQLAEVTEDQMRALMIAPGDTDEQKLQNASEQIYSFMLTHYHPFFEDEDKNGFLIQELARLYTNGNLVQAAVALGNPGAGQWITQNLQTTSITKNQIEEALKHAVETGNTKAVEFLINHFRNFIFPILDIIYVFAPNELETSNNLPTDKTLLMVAIAKGYPEIVKRLLEAGARPEIYTKDGRDALMYAAYYGYPYIITLLLKTGIAINKIYPAFYATALAIAAAQGNRQAIELLLEQGAGVDRADQKMKVTPLMIAAEFGYLNIVEDLLKAHALVNLRDADDFTALIFAADAVDDERKSFYPVIVKKLLEAGANVNMMDLNGWTPLMHAAYRGNYEIVGELVYAGAEKNVASEEGESAFTLAEELPEGHAKTMILHWLKSKE